MGPELRWDHCQKQFCGDQREAKLWFEVKYVAVNMDLFVINLLVLLINKGSNLDEGCVMNMLYLIRKQNKISLSEKRDVCSNNRGCVCWKVELTIPITQYISTVNMLTNFTWQKAMDPNCNCSPETLFCFSPFFLKVFTFAGPMMLLLASPATTGSTSRAPRPWTRGSPRRRRRSSWGPTSSTTTRIISRKSFSL